MTKKALFLSLLLIFIAVYPGFCQDNGNTQGRILMQGLVMDATTLSPVANSQIMLNRTFTSVSGSDGTFSLYVHRNDTVLFKSMGYKSTFLYVSDTLKGNEFIAGIFLNSDTLVIGEVVIVPRFINLKSEIMNAKSRVPSTFDNAKYNVAVSAYQGRTSQSKLGDPVDNYSALRNKQKVDAYERGGIPSDKILGLSPLLLIPAAYLLIKGVPEKPPPIKSQLSDQEIDQIHKKYIETLQRRK
jgi:hypothetical protein